MRVGLLSILAGVCFCGIQLVPNPLPKPHELKAADPFSGPSQAAFRVFEAMKLRDDSFASSQGLYSDEALDALVSAPVSYKNLTVTSTVTSEVSSYFTPDETAGYQTSWVFVENQPYVLVHEGDDGIVNSTIQF